MARPAAPRQGGRRSPKKALGRVYGFAVRFGCVPADGASLVVGEGIETVLSLVTAVPAITAAAALSAGSLGAFAPPPGVAHLVIARDNDDEGALAAERLARRWARAGVAAAVLVPKGEDFNDDLVALGAPAVAACFAPLFRFAGGREEQGGGQARLEKGEAMVAVVNLKHEPDAVANGAVLIDRRTRWGNPFVIGRDGTRPQVIVRYRADLWRRIRAGEIPLAELAALNSRRLACHCAPRPCHGLVLARAAAWPAAEAAAEIASGR